MRTYGWRTRSDALREIALIGIGAGIAISMIESGGTKEFPTAHTFIRNAIIGTIIVSITRGGETLFSRRIERSARPVVLRVIIYMLTGWLGYFTSLGVLALSPLGVGSDEFHLTYHFIYSIVACAVIALGVGFIIHHNQQRNDRLKAIEFAEKELVIAREMQQRLLPPPVIEQDDFRITARTQAAHIVGGDFYDVIRLADGSLGVVIADVSGKGIGASLLMASCKAMIPLLSANGGVGDVIRALNERLCEQLGKREFVAMIFVRFDPASGELEIVNAGTPDP